jgi:hypothetical protein
MNPNLAIAETRQQFLPLPVILRPREREKVPTQEADEGRRDKNHSCGEGLVRGRRSAEGELYSNFGVHGEGWPLEHDCFLTFPNSPSKKTVNTGAENIFVAKRLGKLARHNVPGKMPQRVPS